LCNLSRQGKNRTVSGFFNPIEDFMQSEPSTHREFPDLTKTIMTKIAPACADKLKATKPQRREPDPWNLAIVPQDDRHLPKPIGKITDQYSPDEYELWKLEETKKRGGLLPQRNCEPKPKLRKDKREKPRGENGTASKVITSGGRKS
jgi:hypothetical protein